MRTPRTPDLRQSGFSLTELMVSVAVVAVLGTMGANTYQSYAEGARIASTKATLRSIRDAAVALQMSERKRLDRIILTSGCTSCMANDGSTTWWATPLESWQRLGFSTPPTDAWGRPIIMDANEGEFADCRKDEVWSMGPDGKWFGKPHAYAHVAGGDDLLIEIPFYEPKPDCE